jgi:hypothetical protein
MVYFVRLDFVDQVGQLVAVGQVAVVKKEPGRCLMRIHEEMVDAIGVEGAGSPDKSVNFVALGQEELG